jgi:hypothetical protein
MFEEGGHAMSEVKRLDRGYCYIHNNQDPNCHACIMQRERNYTLELYTEWLKAVVPEIMNEVEKVLTPEDITMCDNLARIQKILEKRLLGEKYGN